MPTPCSFNRSICPTTRSAAPMPPGMAPSIWRILFCAIGDRPDDLSAGHDQRPPDVRDAIAIDPDARFQRAVVLADREQEMVDVGERSSPELKPRPRRSAIG